MRIDDEVKFVFVFFFFPICDSERTMGDLRRLNFSYVAKSKWHTRTIDLNSPYRAHFTEKMTNVSLKLRLFCYEKQYVNVN